MIINEVLIIFFLISLCSNKELSDRFKGTRIEVEDFFSRLFGNPKNLNVTNLSASKTVMGRTITSYINSKQEDVDINTKNDRDVKYIKLSDIVIDPPYNITNCEQVLITFIKQYKTIHVHM